MVKKVAAPAIEEPEEIFEYQSADLVEDPGELMATLAEQDPNSICQSGWSVGGFDGAVLQTVDGAAMSARFCIVTRQKAPNRKGNIVQIAPSDAGRGMMLEAYQQNPVVLFNHGEGYSLPIGKSADQSGKLLLTVQKTKAFAEVFFAQSSAFAADIFGLVQEKILQAASVGYMPMKARRLKQAQGQLPPDVLDISPGGPNSCFGGFDFVESDLMEWSIVPIGADPGALRQCLSAGKIAGEKIASPFVQFWLSQSAEARPAIGRGFDAVQLIQSQPETPAVAGNVSLVLNGMTLAGPKATVFSAVHQIMTANNGGELVVRLDGPGPELAEGQSIVDLVKEKLTQRYQSTKHVDNSAQVPVNAPNQSPISPAVVQTPDPMIAILQSLPSVLETQIQKSLAPCLELQRQQVQTLKMLSGTVTP